MCRKAEARAGTATKILESGGCLMIITGLPADMCVECEEKHAEETTYLPVRVRTTVETTQAAVDESQRLVDDSRKTVKESRQLRDRADVLWREVEAVISAARRLRRVWRRDDGDPARR
jgi:YgiT-type zinc finger domain-containing protein